MSILLAPSFEHFDAYGRAIGKGGGFANSKANGLNIVEVVHQAVNQTVAQGFEQVDMSPGAFFHNRFAQPPVVENVMNTVFCGAGPDGDIHFGIHMKGLRRPALVIKNANARVDRKA